MQIYTIIIYETGEQIVIILVRNYEGLYCSEYL